MEKKVITVNGPISPGQLGITMPHVHVLMELRMNLTEGGQLLKTETVSDKVLANKPVTMEILGTIRRHIALVTDNAILGDIDEMANELMAFKSLGGGSVVDCTLIGMGRDPVGLKKISGATGVNIIASAGWYLSSTHPPYIKEKSVNELRDIMVREITVGIQDTGIRAGALKGACSARTPDVPFSGEEEKVLRATARAQVETGAGMCIHPCHHWGRARNHQAYINVLKQEGANLEKVHLSHMEMWARDLDYQKSLLDQGVNVAYDQFGNEYFYQPATGYTSDILRVEGVVNLVKAGYARQIVLANEVSYKASLRKYGGLGYGHVLENIIPDLKYYGVTDEQLNTMLVENPKRLLSF